MKRVLLFPLILTFVQSFVPSAVYVSFQVNHTSAHNRTGDLSIIDSSDDSPLIEISLPSLFPFFGEFIDRVFVSPNGYVQSSPVNLCGCCYCSPCRADYFGMIAGILVDLNTYGDTSSHVSVNRDKWNVTTIYYNRLNFFGRGDPLLDFGIKLFPDGAVNILYDNITHFDALVNGTSKCSWLSGLIGPDISRSGETYRVVKEQIRAQEEWGARNMGVYPSYREEVQSGSHYIACPVSISWGCSPSVIDNSTAVLNITTLSMSCLADRHDRNHSIQIAISISATEDSTSTNILAECNPVIYTTPEEPSPITFTCGLGVDISNVTRNNTNLYVHILWRPASSFSRLDYRLLGSSEEVPPMVLNYTHSSTTAGDGESDQCSLNFPVGYCTPCEITQQSSDLECLSNDLDCAIDDTKSTLEEYHTTASFSLFSTVDAYQTLYMRPSCLNYSCAATFEYDLDRNSECCLISDMDCLGECNGTAVTGLVESGWLMCCSVVDCLGFCGGPAVVDCTGECNGAAVVDCLGECMGGAVVDCLGDCNGAAAIDCTGECNGGKQVDCLGACGGPVKIDCLGDCGGGADIDCLGECNGTAVVDACGICDGTSVSFCPPVNISVYTGANPFNSQHHLLTKYDASNPLFVSTVPVVVSNVNNVSINVLFSFPEQIVFPPFISLPYGVYLIQPFTNISFDIVSNISGLFGHSSAWSVNTIDIK